MPGDSERQTAVSKDHLLSKADCTHKNESPSSPLGGDRDAVVSCHEQLEQEPNQELLESRLVRERFLIEVRAKVQQIRSYQAIARNSVLSAATTAASSEAGSDTCDQEALILEANNFLLDETEDHDISIERISEISQGLSFLIEQMSLTLQHAEKIVFHGGNTKSYAANAVTVNRLTETGVHQLQEIDAEEAELAAKEAQLKSEIEQQKSAMKAKRQSVVDGLAKSVHNSGNLLEKVDKHAGLALSSAFDVRDNVDKMEAKTLDLKTQASREERKDVKKRIQFQHSTYISLQNQSSYFWVNLNSASALQTLSSEEIDSYFGFSMTGSTIMNAAKSVPFENKQRSFPEILKLVAVN